jgi:adenylate cyclase
MRVTLRITITLCIVLVTVATAVSLLSIDYFGSRASLTRFTAVLLDPLATLVGEKTDSFLRPVERAAELSAEQVETDGADPAHFDDIEEDWYSLLLTHPDLFYIQYGDADGNFLMLTRRADGSLATQRILRGRGAPDVIWRERAVGARAVRSTWREESHAGEAVYDPRVRPWYRGAIERDGIFWTPVYIHAAEHRPVITAARRVRAGGRVVGVTSVTIALDRLSGFLGQLRIAKDGRAFVVDRQGHVIAGSNVASVRTDGANARLPSIAEAGGPELGALTGLPDWQRALAGEPRTVHFGVAERQYLGVIRPLRLHGEADWLVATMIPDEDFLRPVESGLRRDIMISAIITVFFVGVGFLLARAVGAALARVVAETEQVEQFRFEGAMPQSRFTEIDQIFRTYDRLKAGLRAFGKYVPLRLVRMLLVGEAEPRLGGRVGIVTVFFSDVRDFTALSETMTPQEVAELLGEYFQCLSDVISDHGGTVDKFIGDGIMAFWNAPGADEEHALKAVRSALRGRAAIASLPHAHILFTRFGLHTCEAMIGNFGARDRFAYTLLGDGINLAARLEGANKEYGTQILLSEATAAEVQSRILCRHVDRVAVKGKSQPTNVFEPICEQAEATLDERALVRDYHAALALYFAGDFAHAAERFAALAERHPQDVPTATMLLRCRRLTEAPPPSPWIAVHELRAK